jgi:hypothetical protein
LTRRSATAATSHAASVLAAGAPPSCPEVATAELWSVLSTALRIAAQSDLLAGNGVCR